MSLTQEERNKIEELLDHRDRIEESLNNIENILKEYFPEEFDIAYQFWIPQIITSLFDNTKWLSRTDRNMQQTIDRLMDRSQADKGVSKYIK